MMDDDDSSLSEDDEYNDESNCFWIKGKKRRMALEIPPTANFDLLSSLASVFPLSDVICTYLPYDDLNTMTKISEIWMVSAIKEMGKRNNYSTIYGFRSKSDKEIKVVDDSDPEKFEEGRSALIFYQCKMVHLHNMVCLHDKCDIKKKTLYEYIAADLLRKGSEFSCLSVENICPRTNYKKDVETFFMGLVFPNIDNISVKQFLYARDAKFNKIHNIIKPNERLEALMVFSMNNPITTVAHLIKNDNLKDAGEIPMAGGVVRGMKLSTATAILKKTDLFCVAFISSGNSHNFYAASIVIGEGEFEESILKFKSEIQYRQKSLLFRFCCIAKENAENEEPLLVKHFPSTELIQVMVNGEIGTNFTAKCTNKNQTSKKRRLMALNYYYEYSSTLLYITWGRMIK